MKKHEGEKISDVCWESSEMTSDAGGVMGLGHKGLEGSLEMGRALKGFFQHCLVIVKKTFEPSSPLAEHP